VRRVALVALALTVGLLGCGGGDGTATSADSGPKDRTAAETTQEKKKPAYPVPGVPPQKRSLEKLVVKNLEVGKGETADWGDVAIVRYVGVYYKTGKIYSQHWGYRYDFKLDGETVGPGWQKGIHGMKVGGRRELLIPSEQIYGDGDLAYVVLLEDVRSSSYEQEGPFAAIEMRGGGRKPEIDPADRPAPKQLLIRDLEEGAGPAARRGDEVVVRYAGAEYESGKISYSGKTQLSQLGSDGWGEAFEEGIEGMKQGGRREVIIPSRRLGGSGAVDYVIEVTRVQPASEE
jgi:FKBP-type peptidyl-prolyl cis-trans isomerase